MSQDLQAQVQHLANRQEALEKRLALLEYSNVRISAMCMDIQNELRNLQKEVSQGFAVAMETIKELRDSLEVVRAKAVQG